MTELRTLQEYMELDGKGYNPTVREYSLAKDGDEYLSTNFQVKEFTCKDGSDKILIADSVVLAVQMMREYYGLPLAIMSGYRSPSHNKKVGGSKNSRHMMGLAVDVIVKGVKPSYVFNHLNEWWTGGLGSYEKFTHIDVDVSKKRRWKG